MRDPGEGWLLGAALLQRPHLVALQQLLIKGLFNQDTQLITVQVHHGNCESTEEPAPA